VLPAFLYKEAIVQGAPDGNRWFAGVSDAYRPRIQLAWRREPQLSFVARHRIRLDATRIW